MNSILQCLSSTEDLVKYFINFYSKYINFRSRTKGLVAKEFSNVIKNLWSQSGRSFQCQKFKVSNCRLILLYKNYSKVRTNYFILFT